MTKLPHRQGGEPHINRFGVIPKGHNMDRLRLITDLSHPEGFSISMTELTCSLSTYITVDKVAS